MKIELKPNNLPKKAGFYLRKHLNFNRPEVAEIIDIGKERLFMKVGGSPFWLENEQDVLWSDEIEFK